MHIPILGLILLIFSESNLNCKPLTVNTFNVEASNDSYHLLKSGHHWEHSPLEA
jgi:hypothetical protein